MPPLSDVLVPRWVVFTELEDIKTNPIMLSIAAKIEHLLLMVENSSFKITCMEDSI